MRRMRLSLKSCICSKISQKHSSVAKATITLFGHWSQGYIYVELLVQL